MHPTNVNTSRRQASHAGDTSKRQAGGVDTDRPVSVGSGQMGTSRETKASPQTGASHMLSSCCKPGAAIDDQ